MKKKKRKIILASILILVILLTLRKCTYSENTDRKFVTDSLGRALILHGVNANPDAKSDSLRVGWPLQEDYSALSERWGFNLVRYLVLWDGIEPQPNQYDTAYFNRIEERLDWCHQAGLFVILDMHQDLYALRYGGDGAPDWAIFDNGEPFELQTPWELNYRQPAVIASINIFWDTERGHPELQEHFIKSTVALVERFKNHPAVLGYDLYNEPVMATTEVFAFEKRYVQPFYEKLIDAIRVADNENWIFYEPTAMGPNQGFKSRLGTFNDPRAGESRIAYFPHIYTLDLDLTGEYAGIPLFIASWASERNRETKRQNSPMLVGEFGLDGSKPGANDYLRNVMKTIDKIGSGWAYWAYTKGGSWSPINKDGSEQEKMDILVRPYPQKVAGKPIKYGFDSEKPKFWLHFESNPTIDAPTEIYIPKRSFTNDWSIECNQPIGNWRTEWNEDTRILKFYTKADTQIMYKITIY